MDQSLALLSTPEARAVRAAFGSSTEAEMAQVVTAYIAKAQDLGANPLFWSVPRDANPHALSLNTNTRLPVFSLLAQAPHAVKALGLLSAAGASPWLEWTRDALDWHGPQTLVRYALGMNRGGSQSSRKHFLAAASSTALAARDHGAHIDTFIHLLVLNYDLLVKKSSKTAKGVLGPADKQARDVAATLNACEAPLRALAAGLGDAAQSAALEAALTDAKERLAVKNDKVGASVNPDKVKNSLSPERRLRLGSLMALCRDHAHDESLIALAFADTQWLSQEPMAASVRFGREGSLFYAALRGGSREALQGLEKAGANVWLAAAQHGQANACVWAMESLSQNHPDFDVAPLARMLMVGAWLDGAPDPKARCETLAGEALAQITARRHGAALIIQRCQALRSLIERQGLDDLISQYQQERAEPAPRRRGAL
jgi:hypothetical protein